MNDPFESVAEEQISAPVKSRRKAAATRAQRKREKELQDRDILFQQWRKWHDERKTALLAGPYAAAAAELIEFLEHMAIGDAPALIDLIKRGPWPNADADTKFVLLGLVDAAICYLREREGMFPIDDALAFSDEDASAFLIIRGILS